MCNAAPCLWLKAPYIYTTGLHSSVCVCVCACLSVCVRVSVCAWVSVCVCCVNMCMCVCVCVCMCASLSVCAWCVLNILYKCIKAIIMLHIPPTKSTHLPTAQKTPKDKSHTRAYLSENGGLGERKKKRSEEWAKSRKVQDRKSDRTRQKNKTGNI